MYHRRLIDGITDTATPTSSHPIRRLTVLDITTSSDLHPSLVSYRQTRLLRSLYPPKTEVLPFLLRGVGSTPCLSSTPPIRGPVLTIVCREHSSGSFPILVSSRLLPSGLTVHPTLRSRVWSLPRTLLTTTSLWTFPLSTPHGPSRIHSDGPICLTSSRTILRFRN